MSNGAPGPGHHQLPNFAGLSSFDNFPAGESYGPLGTAIARFRTDGGTAYDYVPHVADVAMTIIFGPIGSGKTALLMFLLAMFEQSMAWQKSNPAHAGRSCSSIRTGAASCWSAPAAGHILNCAAARRLAWRRCAACKNTKADADFLRGWIIALIQSDEKGTLSPDEEKRLDRAIARQLSMPVELRSLAGLREFLGHSDPMGCGPRLEKWCRGNALGWAFDGDHDDVRVDESDHRLRHDPAA